MAKTAIPAAAAEADVAATTQVETDVSVKTNAIDAKIETAIRALQFEDEVGELMKVFV